MVVAQADDSACITMVRTCMISAASGPTMCTPTTESVSLCTIIFIKVRSCLPESVFFMGLNLDTYTSSSPAYFVMHSCSEKPTVPKGGWQNTCTRERS